MARTLFALLILLVNAGCGIQIQRLTPPALTANPATPTFTSTVTPNPTETQLPPPPSPTVVPVDGVTMTQLNVRAQPSTASTTLGVLPANTNVQIVGKDPGESWWQILYPAGDEGKGWVVAQYISTAGKPNVPIIGGGGVTSSNGNIAIVQQQINIRSGPGTNYNSLGTLNPQDVVTLTGKDANGVWLQIDFATGPEGKGWINSAFVQATGIENLPIVTDAGQVIGTGTPASTLPPPLPTIVSAPNDNDSAQAPLAHVTFDPNNITSLLYSGDVSAPAGDHEDWLAFTPYSPAVVIKLECRGSAAILSVTVLQNNKIVHENITCGTQFILPTTAGLMYFIHLQASATGNLQYVSYTILVNTVP